MKLLPMGYQSFTHALAVLCHSPMLVIKINNQEDRKQLCHYHKRIALESLTAKMVGDI